MGRDSAIIVGLSTSRCVRATALDAVQHGFVPIVVGYAVGNRDRRQHKQALSDLNAKCVDPVSVDEVIVHLESVDDRRYASAPSPIAAAMAL